MCERCKAERVLKYLGPKEELETEQGLGCGAVGGEQGVTNWKRE